MLCFYLMHYIWNISTCYQYKNYRWDSLYFLYYYCLLFLYYYYQCILYPKYISVQTSQFQLLNGHMWLVSNVLDSTYQKIGTFAHFLWISFVLLGLNAGLFFSVKYYLGYIDFFNNISCYISKGNEIYILKGSIPPCSLHNIRSS